MSFNVRLFGHNQITRLHDGVQKALHTDSIYQLKQPYLWASGVLPSTGATPVTYTQTAIPAGQTQDTTSILRVEIQDGQSIRYEVNPPNRSVAASASSPIMTGRNQIEFGVQWQFSFIDAAAVAS